jgi:alpha-mannosidase
MTAGSGRIDIAYDIDWGETDKVLKVAWPVDVHTHEVASEIQYGHVVRPVHQNTVLGRGPLRVLRPPLDRCLRAGLWRGAAQRRQVRPRCAGRHAAPDAADRIDLPGPSRRQGPAPGSPWQCCRTWATWPTARWWPKAGASTTRCGPSLRLHHPVLTSGLGTSADASTVAPAAPVTCDIPGVTVEAAKAAEDGSGDLVVRLAEVYGARVERHAVRWAPRLHRRCGYATCWRTRLLRRR